ncbi:hypothetical protein [Candidatus Ichthyocystis sparus]|uniref:hypothetical protein n=1 Tax=Candidatus Ichthyocystis sparus TaxID=1561004 RepID=UPI000B8A4CA0|nr:hypothetical protein [Candidatus Ichthyocystis sparus]
MSIKFQGQEMPTNDISVERIREVEPLLSSPINIGVYEDEGNSKQQGGNQDEEDEEKKRREIVLANPSIFVEKYRRDNEETVSPDFIVRCRRVRHLIHCI